MAEDRMLNDEILLGLIKANGGGGGGGTTNYNSLSNKPQIAGTELQGNKTLADLGIASAQSVTNITNGESINDFAGVETALDDVETVLATKQNATDNNLNTEAKTIVGAINEHEGDIDSLKSGLTNLSEEVNGDATVYPFADVITINDAVPANLADCSVKVEPVQDLHGYDKPWVGGAGKNKLPMTVDSIKAANTVGTWSGNAYTINGVTFTVNTDDADNVVGVSVSGTASGNSDLILNDYSTYSAASYNVNGCPASGSESTYCLIAGTSTTRLATDTGLSSGFTLTVETSLRFAIRIFSGYTASNLTFYPMIRLATETDYTFAPYTNICPISGHTEAVVTREGKNLCYAQKVNNTTIAKVKRGYTYTFSCDIKSGITISVNWFKNNIQGGQLGTGIPFTFTADEDFNLYINGSGISGGTFVDNTSNYQLELGSTATPYEPFRGKTYTLALGDTIYGCELDVDSGVMTVDRAIYTISSTSDFRNNEGSFPSRNFIANDDNPNGKGGGSVVSNKYEQIPVSSYTGVYISNAGKLRINTENTYSSLQDALDGELNGAQFCYELATPFTVQLTPQQIQLLQGQNTLYASTGQISVTVNGVSGAIGSVQEQVNGLAEEVEEIKPLNYSTTEQATGRKWLNKPTYLVVIDMGEEKTVTSNNWYTVGNHLGAETIVNGMGVSGGGGTIPMQIVEDTNDGIKILQTRNTQVGVRYVWLEYTKTT